MFFRRLKSNNMGRIHLVKLCRIVEGGELMRKEDEDDENANSSD